MLEYSSLLGNMGEMMILRRKKDLNFWQNKRGEIGILFRKSFSGEGETQ